MSESTNSVEATVRAFVVRSETGDLIHVHQEVAFADTPKSDEEPEGRALRLAGDRGRTGRVEEVAVDALPVPAFRAPKT
ncbi:hypothetical protein [Mycobacterium sp. RTGN5]|uniref:hypothetical protein n=1 Tax=Mycobacterium sp. RTGN5 TaxID=3016522 RepID=UPI0029C6F671|nr:hypothetical protein [Mycobacterium sp. RTGN5]